MTRYASFFFIYHGSFILINFHSPKGTLREKGHCFIITSSGYDDKDVTENIIYVINLYSVFVRFTNTVLFIFIFTNIR